MIKISGNPHEKNEDCIELAHQVCKLAAVDMKKKKKKRNCTQNKKWGHNPKIC